MTYVDFIVATAPRYPAQQTRLQQRIVVAQSAMDREIHHSQKQRTGQNHVADVQPNLRHDHQQQRKAIALRRRQLKLLCQPQAPAISSSSTPSPPSAIGNDSSGCVARINVSQKLVAANAARNPPFAVRVCRKRVRLDHLHRRGISKSSDRRTAHSSTDAPLPSILETPHPAPLPPAASSSTDPRPQAAASSRSPRPAHANPAASNAPMTVKPTSTPGRINCSRFSTPPIRIVRDKPNRRRQRELLPSESTRAHPQHGPGHIRQSQ